MSPHTGGGLIEYISTFIFTADMISLNIIINIINADIGNQKI